MIKCENSVQDGTITCKGYLLCATVRRSDLVRIKNGTRGRRRLKKTLKEMVREGRGLLNEIGHSSTGN